MVAIQDRQPVLHLHDIAPRNRFLTQWEHHRHRNAHWLVECFAEFMGVFFYTFCGVGSTASFIVGGIIGEPTLGSLLQIGLAYAIGVVLALVVCSATSGGHFNPCVTISFVLFKGFPVKKAVRYIVAQILGAYVACLIIYLQWKSDIVLIEGILASAGKLDAINFTPNGPAGIFGLYTQPGANLGFVLANEFFVDVFLALTIWACLDPTNFLAPPVAAPWIIGFAYAAAIWGYAPNGLAANTARDLGGRLMAMTIWGSKASGGKYAAIAALTNIVATIVGAFLYEIFLTDSSRVVPPSQCEFINGHKAHMERRDDRFGPNNTTRVGTHSADEEKLPHSPHSP